MSTLAGLIPASFRGVHFLTPKGNIESGRHAVKHEYPDSNTRYVEDNGLCVPDYKITCIIHGADALDKLKSFEGALNRPGPGTLVHPIHGRLFVQPGKYSLHYDDKDLGVFTVEAEFHVTGPPVFPGRVSGVAAAITGQSTAAIGALFTAFAAQFAAPGLSTPTAGQAGTFAALAGVPLAGGISSRTSVNSLSTDVQSLTAALVASFGGVSAVTVGATAIARAPEAYMADPEALAATWQIMVRAPFAASRTDVDQDALWRGFLDVRDAARSVTLAAAAIVPTTLDLVERQQAKLLLGWTMESVAFAALAEAAAGRAYHTGNEIADDILTLTDSLSAVVDIEIAAPGERIQLMNLLSETVAVLEKKQVTLPRTTSIRVWDMPASVLAYMAYDTDDGLLTLVGLNSGRNPILYDGDVTILNA